jgi:hypothetical protein
MPRRPATTVINPWLRSATALLGLAGLASGGTAVFVTHVEAGPVGLLAVGLILLLIAISGRLPNRIKIGDNEAAWDAVQEFVEDVADRTPGDKQPELIESLNELAEAAPQAAAAGLNAVAYRQLVVKMIYDAFADLPELAPGHVSGGPKLDDRGYDMVVEAADRTVLVEIKHATKWISLAAVSQAVALQASAAQGSGTPVSVLVVIPEPLTSDARTVLSAMPHIYVVVVRGARDRSRLMAALRSALRVTGADHNARYFGP